MCLQSNNLTVIIISGPVCKLRSRECCAFSVKDIFNSKFYILDTNTRNFLRILIFSVWLLQHLPHLFSDICNADRHYHYTTPKTHVCNIYIHSSSFISIYHHNLRNVSAMSILRFTLYVKAFKLHVGLNRGLQLMKKASNTFIVISLNKCFEVSLIYSLIHPNNPPFNLIFFFSGFLSPRNPT